MRRELEFCNMRHAWQRYEDMRRGICSRIDVLWYDGHVLQMPIILDVYEEGGLLGIRPDSQRRIVDDKAGQAFH